MSTYVIHTASGSEYRVRVNGAVYFLRGANVVTEHSRALPKYEDLIIDQPRPWPPVIGSPVFLGTKEKQPDGVHLIGKLTSPVRTVTVEE